MTVKVQEFVRALDIWGIVKSHIDFNEENAAVTQVTIHLEDVGNSFVDVHYYDLSDMMEPEDFNEEPKVTRINLTLQQINNMYRNIGDVVHLPEHIFSLHVHLNQSDAVFFDIRFAPLFK